MKKSKRLTFALSDLGIGILTIIIGITLWIHPTDISLVNILFLLIGAGFIAKAIFNLVKKD